MKVFLSWMPNYCLPNQTAYDEYRIKNVSYRLLAVFLIAGVLQQTFAALQRLPEDHRELAIFIRILFIVCLFPALYATYCIKRLLVNRVGDLQTIAWAGSIALLMDTSSHCFSLIIRTYYGQCPTNVQDVCNPYDNSNSIPHDAALPIILILLAGQMMLKCYHRWAVVLSWLIVVSSILTSIIIMEARASYYIPLMSLVAAFLGYTYETTMYNAFVLLQNLEGTILSRVHAENEKRVTEMRSVEMRHLLGNVAHDLKTPMQSFVMDLEFVNKIMKYPASQTTELISYTSRDLVKIFETVQHLIDTNSFMYMVINRAIDYAKSSEDHVLIPNLETIDVSSSIEWAINVVRSKCVVPVMLEPLSTDIHPHIITDKQWLIENILCLISNAAKFTTTGCVTVRCELQHALNNSVADSDAKLLLIEVEDTGIGIPEDKRESMFHPFQQTMRMAGGTGLGLYSLRKRVEALKGTCGILGRRDGANGARIWFRIPYRPDVQEMGEGSNVKQNALPNEEIELSFVRLISTSKASSISGRLQTPQVLILMVDDSPTIRQSISRSLCNEGYAVHLAENGLMALDMMISRRYDLVLMDLQMPVMDGLEAVRRLRKHEADSNDSYHQKVIGISAYAGEPYCSDALRAGMDGFIEKPFSLSRFLTVSAQHLPHRVNSEDNHLQITLPNSTCESLIKGFPSAAVKFSHLAILLADDSPMIRKSVSRVLHNEGLSVDLAENGQMALEMMGLKRYDLVLMDLQMPVMDGLEAVRRLRQQESENGGSFHQVVIGISGYNGEPFYSDAMAAGMDGFIEKPFTAERFMQWCSDHIDIVLPA